MGRPLDKEKERFWRGVLQAQQRSGDTITTFCDAHRISVHQFYSWRRKLGRRQQARTIEGAKQSTFIPVRLPLAVDAIEIVHPNGCIVRLKSHVNAASLQQVLHALNVASASEV